MKRQEARLWILRWKDGWKQSKTVRIGQILELSLLVEPRFQINWGVWNFGRNLLKKIMTWFLLFSHFLANSRPMCCYKWDSYISWILNGAGTCYVLWKLSRVHELYNYRPRNYLKMSSKMYKIVPVLGVKNKNLQPNWCYTVPHILQNWWFLFIKRIVS